VTRLDGGWRVIVRLEEGFHPRSPTVAGADGASGVAMESRAPESRAFGGVGGREGRWEAWLDAEAVGARLVLRPRQPGDRFQPRGLGGHSMKLNEFMINEKVPRDARAGWPLLEGAHGLAWVCDEQQTSVFLAGSGA
jgi:tRNA(Ile)-lysidine synthetase-like protein